ncbi:MAG: hypothetical protein ACJ0RN_00850 [Candidatus Neomarinimicrobiota bacterium]|nr:hypothetical protein [Flavobacteriaceae bacterium]
MYRSINIILFFISIVQAQALDEFFIDGNNHFNKKNYNKAILSYSQILELGFSSQDLYLNLGNAYFENKDYGNARWSYEMGLKLNPLNEDLNNNNKINKSFIDDYIEVPQNSILDNINIFFQLLSISQFILINSILILTTAISFFIYKVFEIKILKKLFILLSILSFIFLLISFTKNLWDKNNKFGIIIKNESIIYSAPYKNESIEVSKFYSGNKVKIIQSTDIWLEIYSFDGRKGWIRAQDIRNLY